MAEDFDDYSDVRDFRTSIDRIEKLTGIDFGKEVRNADTYRRRRRGRREERDIGSAEELKVSEFEELGLEKSDGK